MACLSVDERDADARVSVLRLSPDLFADLSLDLLSEVPCDFAFVVRFFESFALFECAEEAVLGAGAASTGADIPSKVATQQKTRTTLISAE